MALRQASALAHGPANSEGTRVALSDIDRQLLQRCLTRQPHAWEDFVDRFLGLVVHVINHTSTSRSIAVSPHDLEDLASEVFIAILADDYAALRRFRGQSSLATYLTVISRRVVVKELLKRRHRAQSCRDMATWTMSRTTPTAWKNGWRITKRFTDCLGELDGEEADIVRLYHLEGKSYLDISRETGVPENSIGPALSRARAKMRRATVA